MRCFPFDVEIETYPDRDKTLSHSSHHRMRTARTEAVQYAFTGRWLRSYRRRLVPVRHHALQNKSPPNCFRSNCFLSTYFISTAFLSPKVLLLLCVRCHPSLYQGVCAFVVFRRLVENSLTPHKMNEVYRLRRLRTKLLFDENFLLFDASQ